MVTDDWNRDALGRLTIEDAVARYVLYVADGPACAAHLRNLGFEAWRDRHRGSHARQEAEGLDLEWDSREYTDGELRETFETIILVSERKQEGGHGDA